MAAAEGGRKTAAAADTNAKTIVEVPIEQAAAAIFIRASIDTPASDSDDNTRLWTFLLDTGASHCVIDDSHRASLGVPLGTAKNLSATDGSVMETFASADLHVGDHTLHPRHRFVCFDMKRISGLVGEHVDGVLGMDALRDTVLDIDFDECRLRFMSAAPRLDDHRIAVVWKHGGRPFVEGEFGNDTKLDLLVDTGALEDFAGTLLPDAFENLSKFRALSPIDSAGRSRISTPTDTVKCRFGRTSVFCLGAHTHRDLIFASHPGGNSLGLGYLSRYHVTFDFPHNAIYLRPSRRFLKKDEYRDFTSFLVSRRDGRIIVFRVVKPAADGHIQIGDELISINGRPVTEMTNVGLRRAIACEPLQRVELRRGGVVWNEELDFRDKRQIKTGKSRHPALDSASRDKGN